MIKSYKGTVLFVSHDRYFVRKVATAVLAIENNTATYYPFGYQQYLAKKTDSLPLEKVVNVIKEKCSTENKLNYKKEISKIPKTRKVFLDKGYIGINKAFKNTKNNNRE